MGKCFPKRGAWYLCFLPFDPPSVRCQVSKGLKTTGLTIKIGLKTASTVTDHRGMLSFSEKPNRAPAAGRRCNQQNGIVATSGV